MCEKLVQALFPNNDVGKIEFTSEGLEFWDKTANSNDGLWIDTEILVLQEMLEAWVFSKGYKISTIKREENLYSSDIYHTTKGGIRAIKETKIKAMVEACEWLVL